MLDPGYPLIPPPSSKGSKDSISARCEQIHLLVSDPTTSKFDETELLEVGEMKDRLELVPKDGARLRDLEVVDAAKGSVRFILWTQGLSGYSEAGSDELGNGENERRSLGCFYVARLGNREELCVDLEELRVEG